MSVLAEVSTGGAVWLLCLLFVFACLAGAAYAGFHERWIACLCLIVVAIFAGALLL